jgi:hypothetical protein
MPAASTAAVIVALGANLASIQASVLADAQQRAPGAPVRIVSSEAVTWPDGSLGCPEPGRMYTQALVKGHRIRVEAGGTLLDYHTNASGRWVCCPADRATEPLPDNTQ